MIENESGEKDPNTAATESRKGDVSVHIERLVLDGLPLAPGAAVQLQFAVEGELIRLLAEDGLDRASQGAFRSLPAPAFQYVGNSVPTDLGRQIARSVYESLDRST
jgi:hypothetical protein